MSVSLPLLRAVLLAGLPLLAVLGSVHGKAFLLQAALQGAQEELVIFNEQDPHDGPHIFQAPAVTDAFEPQAARRALMLDRAARFSRLYQGLSAQFLPGQAG